VSGIDDQHAQRAGETRLGSVGFGGAGERRRSRGHRFGRRRGRNELQEKGPVAVAGQQAHVHDLRRRLDDDARPPVPIVEGHRPDRVVPVVERFANGRQRRAIDAEGDEIPVAFLLDPDRAAPAEPQGQSRDAFGRGRFHFEGCDFDVPGDDA